jgi:hypothetical protein
MLMELSFRKELRLADRRIIFTVDYLFAISALP